METYACFSSSDQASESCHPSRRVLAARPSPPYSSRLPLERVGGLEEQGPAGGQQAAAAVHDGPLVVVAEVEDRLPVEAVAEQRREGAGVVARRDGGEIEAGAAVDSHVLGDEAQEGARVEAVDGAHPRHVGGEQAPA